MPLFFSRTLRWIFVAASSSSARSSSAIFCFSKFACDFPLCRPPRLPFAGELAVAVVDLDAALLSCSEELLEPDFSTFSEPDFSSF